MSKRRRSHPQLSSRGQRTATSSGRPRFPDGDLVDDVAEALRTGEPDGIVAAGERLAP